MSHFCDFCRVVHTSSYCFQKPSRSFDTERVELSQTLRVIHDSIVQATFVPEAALSRSSQRVSEERLKRESALRRLNNSLLEAYRRYRYEVDDIMPTYDHFLKSIEDGK